MPDFAATPHQTYAARYTALSAQTKTNHHRVVLLQVALVFTLGTSLALVVLSLRGRSSWWPLASSAVAFLVILYVYLRNRREHDRLTRLLALYDRALARVDGTAPQSGHTGESFRTAAHLYDRDLAILGPDSLFGMLATVRTGVGQRGLGRDLLQPHTREATVARQTSIRELAPRLDVREEIQLLGVSDFQQVGAAFLDSWLDDPPPSFHPVVRPLLVLLTVLLLGGLLAGARHLVPWSTLNPNLLLVLSAQAALGVYLRPRILPILQGAANLSNQMRMFEEGLALLQRLDLGDPYLAVLRQSSVQPHNAVSALQKIQSQFVVVQQRNQGPLNIFLVFSLFTNAGTHAALSIAAWKRQHAAAMKQWLAAWAEFESLNALATYAFEHPENAYPEILHEGTAVFEASALAHPLLPGTAVPNDIALNAAQSLYLISGSNMAGKSTLLRAIGLNAVLAAAGAPIRATSARIAPLAPGASLALTDSLAEGKSKFLAEVERLHAILKLAEGDTPVLFLIDEIFSGTNSLDRRAAAEAVARTLIERGAIGALSTHDLTLTEMAADPALRAANVHMASADPADPLAFDYRLRPGVNPASNALAILRLIGVDLPAA